MFCIGKIWCLISECRWTVAACGARAGRIGNGIAPLCWWCCQVAAVVATAHFLKPPHGSALRHLKDLHPDSQFPHEDCLCLMCHNVWVKNFPKLVSTAWWGVSADLDPLISSVNWSLGPKVLMGSSFRHEKTDSRLFFFLYNLVVQIQKAE